MDNENPGAEILIIEDEVIISRLHKFGIEKMTRARIRTLNNGRHALDYLEKEAPPDVSILVFLDLNMPEMDGWEFMESCEKLHAHRDIKVIVVTSSPHKADMERVREYESVIGYYLKPLKARDITGIFELPQVASGFSRK